MPSDFPARLACGAHGDGVRIDTCAACQYRMGYYIGAGRVLDLVNEDRGGYWATANDDATVKRAYLEAVIKEID